MSEPTQIGLALCCGVPPVYGRDGGAYGYSCPKCGTKHYGWGSNPQWLAGLWNKAASKTTWNKHGEHWSEKTLVYHDEAPLDLPGWHYAAWEYSFHPAYGERRTTEGDFVLFQAPGRDTNTFLKSKDGYECVIDDSRCLQELRVRTLEGVTIDVPIPKMKSSSPVQAYVSRSWSTDNRWWYRLSITTYNYKWHQRVTTMLVPLIGEPK